MAAAAVVDDETLKQQLYSRQGYVVGQETQRKYGEMRVAVVGLDGPGCEVAKNLILTGVQRVTLVDDAPIALRDLGTIFYATENDVGKPRAKVLEAKLAELNRFTQVAVEAADPKTNLATDATLSSHTVVIYCNKYTTLLTQENELCRQKGVKFVSVESRGVCGCIFVDCGDDFTVYDTNGEELVTCVVTGVDQANNVILMNDDKKHETEPGDKVYFTEMESMPSLNSPDPANPNLIEVAGVVGPFAIKIKPPPGFADAPAFDGKGGYLYTTKQPVKKKFASLKDAITDPAMAFIHDDEQKLTAPSELHGLFRGLHKVIGTHQASAFDAPVDSAALLKAAQSVAGPDAVPPALVELLAPTLHGQLNPMACFLGGFAAQEVLKAGSGKFSPVQQWLYYDARELLQINDSRPTDTAAVNSRYDGQIALFGAAFQQKVLDSSAFIVGAGALGCEHIKNLALMGFGAGATSNSKITVTDMDTIELSNLSRQFLFRSHHIGQPKSRCAAEAARTINTAVRVDAKEDKVARETEGVFHEEFWENQTIIVNALDNVLGRKYVDERCVEFQRPLFESGTLGAKCNTQTVIPFLTENYGNSADPPERDIPLCTLKNTPSSIEHTIQWARDAFHGCFAQGPQDCATYMKDRAAFMQSLQKDPSNRPTVLKSIVDGLHARPKSAEDCVRWARLKFEEFFNHGIQQLLHNMPADLITPAGVPFWSGARRPPTPLVFRSDDPQHLAFVSSAAAILARVYNLSDAFHAFPVNSIATIASETPVPSFVPRKVEYAMDDKAKSQADPTTVAAADLTEADLPNPATLPADLRITAEDFEKDDDANSHIDFITATSNLRATNYGIPTADRIRTKMIAGKIIPAMITTTALVTGLVGLEILKYMLGCKSLALYRNAFVNIALPLMALSEPMPVPTGTTYTATDGRKMSFSMWDKLEVGDGADITVGAAIDAIEQRYGIEVCMMSTPGGLLVFNGLMPSRAARETTVRAKLEALYKKPLDKSVRTVSLILNATANDEDLVDLPAVRFRLH